MKNTTTFEKTFSILEATGTNWSVEKLPLITPCGKTTESFGNFRSDNGQWLGTFKEAYQPMQNAALVELLVDATAMLNLEVTKGGTLRNGGRVYYQMELPTEYIGKSDVKRQITALNSHDGSSAISFGSSNMVVVCNNTFNRVHKELEKVKHTINSGDRVRAMAENLKQTIASDILMVENFKRMADLQLKDEIVESLISKLFKIDTNKAAAEASTRTKNQIVTFANNLNTEIQLEGKTIWGLFNAVTRYTNHEAAPKEAEKKNDYLMFGTGAKLSNLAYNELLAYVTANAAEYHFINA